jgi:hypothetical protein
MGRRALTLEVWAVVIVQRWWKPFDGAETASSSHCYLCGEKRRGDHHLKNYAKISHCNVLMLTQTLTETKSASCRGYFLETTLME